MPRFIHFVLLAALYGLVWSSEIVRQLKYVNDDTVITSQLVKGILIFLLSGLIWAFYLAIKIVPAIAQLFINFIFNTDGPGLSSSPTEEPKPESPPPEESSPSEIPKDP
jgi:hypothetical protein